MITFSAGSTLAYNVESLQGLSPSLAKPHHQLLALRVFAERGERCCGHALGYGRAVVAVAQCSQLLDERRGDLQARVWAQGGGRPDLAERQQNNRE